MHTSPDPQVSEKYGLSTNTFTLETGVRLEGDERSSISFSKGCNLRDVFKSRDIHSLKVRPVGKVVLKLQEAPVLTNFLQSDSRQMLEDRNHPQMIRDCAKVPAQDLGLQAVESGGSAGKSLSKKKCAFSCTQGHNLP